MIDLQNLRSKVLAIRPHLLRGSWASAEALVAPLIFFLLSPWLLNSLGTNGFGQWTLALTIGGFTHVASLGAGASTMYAVSAYIAKDEDDRSADAIKAGFFIAFIAAIIFMILAWLVSESVARTLFSKMGEPRTVVAVLLFGVCALGLQELDAVFAGALRGMQRYDLVALFELLGRPVWALSISITAFLTSDVFAILIAHNIYYLTRLIVRARVAASLFKKSCFGLPTSVESLLEIVNFGKWISLQSIGGILFSTIDKVLVGWLFGSSELARYSICLQVAQFSHSLQAAGLQIITPWVALKKSNWTSTINNNSKTFRLSLWLGAGCLIFPMLLFFSSWPILKMWMGFQFANNNVDLLRVLLIGTAILSFTIPAHYVLLGLGKAKFTAILLVTAGAVSLLSSISLAVFGLMGFAFGRIMYGVIAFIYLIPIWRIHSKD